LKNSIIFFKKYSEREIFPFAFLNCFKFI